MRSTVFKARLTGVELGFRITYDYGMRASLSRDRSRVTAADNYRDSKEGNAAHTS